MIVKYESKSSIFHSNPPIESMTLSLLSGTVHIYFYFFVKHLTGIFHLGIIVTTSCLGTWIHLMLICICSYWNLTSPKLPQPELLLKTTPTQARRTNRAKNHKDKRRFQFGLENIVVIVGKRTRECHQSL